MSLYFYFCHASHITHPLYIELVQYNCLLQCLDFHLFKCFIYVIGDSFYFHFLMDQLILNLVNPDVESLNVHLGVLRSCFSYFQPFKS